MKYQISYRSFFPPTLVFPLILSEERTKTCDLRHSWNGCNGGKEPVD
ncbi:hypothetical protein Sinac_6359 [Singulisphaera acidiphila DSM 18658]|uniref:Uncharacterized protein n=1 Tax=Singulisphaera acidiphila (strain ATCC BAA-1392 / DSM 18658 / VKM B-2454 / MOB10) TaxID=886293 RepID=L0DM36_SINAD|nr:hypothetical protein Sinac_6359 [Singulisphaera acidiphila DSM 18658]